MYPNGHFLQENTKFYSFSQMVIRFITAKYDILQLPAIVFFSAKHKILQLYPDGHLFF